VCLARSPEARGPRHRRVGGARVAGRMHRGKKRGGRLGAAVGHQAGIRVARGARRPCGLPLRSGRQPLHRCEIAPARAAEHPNPRRVPAKRADAHIALHATIVPARAFRGHRDDCCVPTVPDQTREYAAITRGLRGGRRYAAVRTRRRTSTSTTSTGGCAAPELAVGGTSLHELGCRPKDTARWPSRSPSERPESWVPADRAPLGDRLAAADTP